MCRLPYIQVYLDTALSKFMVHVTSILVPTKDTMTRATYEIRKQWM